MLLGGGIQLAELNSYSYYSYYLKCPTFNKKITRCPKRLEHMPIYRAKEQSTKTVPEETQTLNLLDRLLNQLFQHIQRTK